MISRRGFVAGGAGLLSASALQAIGTARAAELFPIVETDNGRMRGIVSGGVAQFKGIRYAASAEGKNRFRAPQPVEKWSGIRDHLDFGPIAPQIPGNPRHVYAKLIYNDLQYGGMGEDCLNLNVWTPGPGDGAKRPVIVRFHGGGFYGGSSNTPGADGAALARFGDVVVVTINHRLSSLGYLYLGEDEDFADSGTVGIQDLVAALRWVNTNIEAFGGDPDRVLIFGQSGGGAKTSCLLAMPTAKELYHRAGVMSGSMMRAMPREMAAEASDVFLKQLGLSPGEVRKLQRVPYQDLLKAQAAVEAAARAAGEAPRSFAPVLGDALPRHPFDPDSPAVSADVPIIVSSVLDERTYRQIDFDISFETLETELQKTLGDRAGAVLAMYREEDPAATAFLLKSRIVSDQTFWKNAITMAERKSAGGAAPVWSYLWTKPSDAYGGRYGATHGIDVAPSMNEVRFPLVGSTAENRVLADQISGAWVAFARTGDPNHDGIPTWPSYNTASRATMVFDTPVEVENDPRATIRRYWAG